MGQKIPEYEEDQNNRGDQWHLPIFFLYRQLPTHQAGLAPAGFVKLHGNEKTEKREIKDERQRLNCIGVTPHIQIIAMPPKT